MEEKEIELQKYIEEEEKRCRREEIEEEENRKRQEIAQLEEMKQANEAQRQIAEEAKRQEELRKEADREKTQSLSLQRGFLPDEDGGKQTQYGAIPKLPSQQRLRGISHSEYRELDDRENRGVDRSIGKVLDRDIIDMNKGMTHLGLTGRTSTMRKLFEVETDMTSKRDHRQDYSANQVNDFGEDNRQLHTLQDADVFDQQYNLLFKPQLVSSLEKEISETYRSSPRLPSGNCHGIDSAVKQELNAFGGIDPKTAFFQGYRLALEEMKKEGITTLSKRNDKDLSEQQSQERVSVATERFIGQNKEDRNSDYLKQINYRYSEKFDERELKLEEERLRQRERLVEERQRRQKILAEKKEQIHRAELELMEKEKWLKEQEDTINDNTLAPIDGNFRYQDKELELRAEQIRIRKKDLERRESLLGQTQNAPKELQIKDIKQDPKMEQERILQQLEKKQEMFKEKGSEVDRTFTEKSSLHQEEATASKEKIVFTDPYSFPKLSPFSGDEIRSKNVASYEEWKYEVDCLMQDGSYKESQLGQAIRKSLRSQAKRVVMPLGASASVSEIMKKLESVFGSVATRESIMREFYTATQQQEESVTAWGLRLEEILQRAMEKGHVRAEDRNDLLKDTFWRGLRSEKLKNATRVHFESISNFELLRRAVREEENQIAVSTGIKLQQQKVDVPKTGNMDEDPKYKQLQDQITALQKQLKYRYPKKWYDYRLPPDPSEEEKNEEGKKDHTDTKKSNP